MARRLRFKVAADLFDRRWALGSKCQGLAERRLDGGLKLPPAGGTGRSSGPLGDQLIVGAGFNNRTLVHHHNHIGMRGLWRADG